jgi:hypothetical protein
MSIHGDEGMRAGHCLIPQGKRPHYGHFLLVQTAMAGAEQRSVWTDEFGRTATARQAYQLEKETLPRSGGVAEMKFTHAYDEQDGLRNECARKITALKAEAKLLECECKNFKSVRPEAFHDPNQSNLMLTFQHDIRKSIAENPLYAETGKVGQSKLYVKAAERVLLDAQNHLAEAETADRVSEQEQKTDAWKTEQKTRKAYETKITEVIMRYKEYNDFITDDGDQQLNVYFWNGFQADIKHKADLAAIESGERADRAADEVGIGHKPRKLVRCPAIPNPEHQYDDDDDEPVVKKQKTVTVLDVAKKIMDSKLYKQDVETTLDYIVRKLNSCDSADGKSVSQVQLDRFFRTYAELDDIELAVALGVQAQAVDINITMFREGLGRALEPEKYVSSVEMTQEF